MQLGMLGGAFDPPHMAHLVLAQQAYEQLSLDQVLFVPVGEPAHKLHPPLWSAEQRLSMVQRAIADNPAFEASRLDIDRPGPHYSVDLVVRLQERFPQATLVFLMGSDELRALPGWRRPEELIRLTDIAVMRRPGPEPDLSQLERTLPGLTRRLHWIDAPMLDLSSAELRRWIEAGRSVRYFVPDPVWRWLEDWKVRKNAA